MTLDPVRYQRENLRPMQGRVFPYEMTIREHHLDHFGHVNNAKYLEIFEEARWDLISHCGLGLQWVLERGLGPVIVDVKVRFRKELLLREKIRIESHVASYRKILGHFEQKIFNSQGVLCTEAMFIFSIFDLHKRRMVPPDKEWIAALGILPETIPQRGGGAKSPT